MNRRALLLAVAAVFASHRLANAQAPARLARVGILFAGTEAASAGGLKTTLDGLRALGWRLGENLRVEVRYGGVNAAGLPQAAAELVRLKPDVIVCAGPAPAVALKKLDPQVPVVFMLVADPVGLGLAQSLGRPGGMFTGPATLAPEFMLAKQVELLRETGPRATRIAFLSNPDNPIHVQSRELRLEVAKTQGLTAIELQARTRAELESAFAEAARQKAGFMYLSGDPLALEHRDLVASLALNHRLPVMFLFFQHVEAGGLMSYGIDLVEQNRHATRYVDKILKGAAPRDLPIEEPVKYLLVINMKTAKALGLAIPQAVLLRADRVIE